MFRGGRSLRSRSTSFLAGADRVRAGAWRLSSGRRSTGCSSSSAMVSAALPHLVPLRGCQHPEPYRSRRPNDGARRCALEHELTFSTRIRRAREATKPAPTPTRVMRPQIRQTQGRDRPGQPFAEGWVSDGPAGPGGQAGLRRRGVGGPSAHSAARRWPLRSDARERQRSPACARSGSPRPSPGCDPYVRWTPA